MRIKLSIIFLLLSMNIHAQQKYFSNRYNLDYGEFSYSVLQHDSQYTILSSCYSHGGSKIRTLLSITDSLGSVLFTKSVESSYRNYYPGQMGSLIETDDGGYAAGGTITDSTVNGDGILYKFNSIGDTLWTAIFGDTAFQKFNQVKKTRDGGYILIGGSSSLDYWQDVWLLKTDSLGNFEWEKFFGHPGELEEGSSVVQTADGGYFIGGERYNYSTEDGDWLMIKTDSLGNQQWEKLFGGPYGESCYSVLEAQDGSLVGGGFYTDYCLGPHNGSPFCRPNIIKLDTAGNLIWNKKYGPSKYITGLVSICETPDGGIAGTGSYYEDSVPIAQFKGMVIKADSQGDSVWFRNYTHLNYHSDNSLYDIRTTSDGGFIISGNLQPMMPDTGFIDTWILKLDSTGCEVSNCWLNVGLKDPDLYIDDFVIYPNPSTGIFHIQTREEIETTEVFSYTGQQILFSNAKAYEIDLSKMPTGIYFYKITTRTNKIFQGKVLKE
ncbi:lipoprotein [soil metagenome]